MRKLTAAAVMALIVVSCGDGGSDPAPAAVPTTGSTTPTAAAPATTDGPATPEPPPATTSPSGPVPPEATTSPPTTGPTPTTTMRPRPDGEDAPDFTLALGQGGTFTLSLEQKPVYMVFWAEW